MITVSQLTEVNEASARELNVLMDDLRSGKSRGVTASVSDIETLLKDKDIHVVVVKDGEQVVGVATLYILPKIGKKIATVEDVIVSGDYRGQGLGEKLMRKVIEIAKGNKVVSLSLTSRPERVAAHKLYEKLGFKIKETDVFKLTF